MHACKNGDVKLAKLLVSFGADPRAENEEVVASQYILTEHIRSVPA